MHKHSLKNVENCIILLLLLLLLLFRFSTHQEVEKCQDRLINTTEIRCEYLTIVLIVLTIGYLKQYNLQFM